MIKFFTAVAVALALPSVALAQAAPVPAPKGDCCAKMKAEGKKCCCAGMEKMDHAEHAEHADHDMSAKPTVKK